MCQITAFSETSVLQYKNIACMITNLKGNRDVEIFADMLGIVACVETEKE